MKKKFLSALLTLAMVLTMIPMATGVAFAEPNPIDGLWVNGVNITATGTYLLGEGKGSFEVKTYHLSTVPYEWVEIVLHDAIIDTAISDSNNAGICYKPSNADNGNLNLVLCGTSTISSNTMEKGVYCNRYIEISLKDKSGIKVSNLDENSLNIVSKVKGIETPNLMIKANTAVSITSEEIGIDAEIFSAYGGKVSIEANSTATNASKRVNIQSDSDDNLEYYIKSTNGCAINTKELSGTSFSGEIYISGEIFTEQYMDINAKKVRLYGSNVKSALKDNLPEAEFDSVNQKFVVKDTELEAKTIYLLGAPEIKISNIVATEENHEDVCDNGKFSVDYSNYDSVIVNLEDGAEILGLTDKTGIDIQNIYGGGDVTINVIGKATIGSLESPADYGIRSGVGNLKIVGDADSELTIYDCMAGITIMDCGIDVTGYGLDLTEFKGKMIIYETEKILGPPPACCLSVVKGKIEIDGGTYDLKTQNQYAIDAKNLNISNSDMYISGGCQALRVADELQINGEKVTGDLNMECEVGNLNAVNFNGSNYVIEGTPVKTLYLQAGETSFVPSFDIEKYREVLAEAERLQTEIDAKRAAETAEPIVGAPLTEAQAKALVTEMVPVVRTENVARGVRVYLQENPAIDRLKASGYKVLYDFYRVESQTVPTADRYKITTVVNKAEPWYLNTAAQAGKKYYYKVVAKVYNKEDVLLKETELTQAKYGCRTMV